MEETTTLFGTETNPPGDFDDERYYGDDDEGQHGLTITQQIDMEALSAGWKAIDAMRPTLNAVLSVGAKSDLGCVRENNEDKFDLLEPRESGILAAKGRLYGVADGMGGHSAGQIASELALKTLIRAYYANPATDVEQSLRIAIIAANAAVFEDAQTLPERQGMGTTLTAVVVREDKLHVIHIGDSRAYLIRDNEIRQITQDHSWVAEQVRIGGMTLDEAMSSPFRNIILRSVGTGPAIEPEYVEEALRPGDAVLICSDGLTGHVEEETLAEYASANVLNEIGPSVAALRLVDLACDRGGRDNVTVIVLFVERIEPFADGE